MNLVDRKAFAQIDSLRIGRLASRARLSRKNAERRAREMVTKDARMSGAATKGTLPLSTSDV
jgi:hypothetical protein